MTVPVVLSDWPAAQLKRVERQTRCIDTSEFSLLH